MNHIRHFVFFVIALGLFSGCQNQSQQGSSFVQNLQGQSKESIAPEQTYGRQSVKGTQTSKAMVVAAHPLAAKAGEEILKQGGTALDAAFAVQAMLTLVEPQSSGLGGGLFLLYHDAKAGKLTTIDGREMAPLATDPWVFTTRKIPLEFFQAVVGGISVGVPGTFAAFMKAHQKFGKLSLEQIFAPTIKAAEEGFKVTKRLQESLKSLNYLKESPQMRRLFFQKDGKTPVAVGALLKNEDLARTLRLLSKSGRDGFYKGDIAQKIVTSVRTAHRRRGKMTMKDLADYKAKEREPLCGKYRDYKICSMGPPTSGGVAILQILGMLSHHHLAKLKPHSIEAIHLIAEASKIAFADRDQYLADPDFVDVPLNLLLDPEYLEQRAQQISPDSVLKNVEPGKFEQLKVSYAKDTTPDWPSTTHFVVVDEQGNWLSTTSSIEFRFGSSLMAGGFLLNNELTDFSFVPEKKGRPVANAVAPGKRPRSSMSPIIVYDADNKPMLAVGSAGGSRIIGHVLKTIIAVLDWNQSIQEAISSPHYLCRGKELELEKDTPIIALRRELIEMGHDVELTDQNSGLHGIEKTSSGYRGGVDPRREGKVAGY